MLRASREEIGRGIVAPAACIAGTAPAVGTLGTFAANISSQHATAASTRSGMARRMDGKYIAQV